MTRTKSAEPEQPAATRKPKPAAETEAGTKSGPEVEVGADPEVGVEANPGGGAKPEDGLGDGPEAGAGAGPGIGVGAGAGDEQADGIESEAEPEPRARGERGAGGGGRSAASGRAAEAGPRRLSADPLVRTALVVTMIAALVAGWYGWSYRSASGDESLAYAKERDRVLAAAGQAIVNLNTLDHRDVDAGLKNWQDSSTAELYDEIAQGRARLKSDVEKAKTTSSAKVVESALTELDTRAGKAAVIAAVRITITRAGEKPAENIRRFSGQLTRTSDGWKLSALGQASTGTP